MQVTCNTTIWFGGKKFPANGNNCKIGCVQTTSGVKLGVPMVYIELTDNTGWMEKANALADGTHISILMETSDRGRRTTNWRLNYHKINRTSTTVTYLIDGYLKDATRYWMDTAPSMYKGTSYSVLSDIASECGLKFVGDSTADSQTWIGASLPFWRFAKRIASAGYASDSSCMALALDQNGRMVYKDIQNPKRIYNMSFLEHVSGADTVISHQPVSSSGSSNYMYGNVANVRQDLGKDTTQTLDSNIKINSRDGSPNINAEVKSGLQNPKVTYSPSDSGNLHENYQRAIYQNQRLASLMSSGLDVLLAAPSRNIGILDSVNYKAPSTVPDAESFNGIYVVATKIIRVFNNEYYEKYELYKISSGSTAQKTTGGLPIAEAGTVLSTALKSPVATISSWTGFDTSKLTDMLKDLPGADTLSSLTTSLTDALGSSVDAAKDAMNGLLDSLSSSIDNQATTPGLSALDAAEQAYLAALGSTPPTPIPGEPEPPDPAAVFVAAMDSALANAVATANALYSSVIGSINKASALLDNTSGIASKINLSLDGLGDKMSQLVTEATAFTTETCARLTGTTKLDDTLSGIIQQGQSLQASVTDTCSQAVSSLGDAAQAAIEEAAGAAEQAMGAVNSVTSTMDSQIAYLKSKYGI